MAQSVWPNDTAIDPLVPVRKLDHLSCFVISPFSPAKRFDDLFELIEAICDELKNMLQVDEFKCVRADKITSAGVIHPEIWQQIKHADILVADVSGHNPNVMLELGVAAAWRRKDQVIIIREEVSEETHAFDINPARHIEYSRTAAGYATLRAKLGTAMFEALAAAPFQEIPSDELKLPLKADFSTGRDCPDLWVPSNCHRRIVADYLEFGSLYVFLRSWLSVGNVRVSNIRVEASLRFTERRETGARCWMGIMLRSQLPFANFGHLTLLRSDGMVAHTARKTEDPATHHDVELGEVTNYKPEVPIEFDVSLDDTNWNIRIGSVSACIPVRELGHVFPSGRVLIQTYMCRVGIHKLAVTHTN